MSWFSARSLLSSLFFPSFFRPLAWASKTIWSWPSSHAPTGLSSLHISLIIISDIAHSKPQVHSWPPSFAALSWTSIACSLRSTIHFAASFHIFLPCGCQSVVSRRRKISRRVGIRRFGSFVLDGVRIERPGWIDEEGCGFAWGLCLA